MMKKRKALTKKEIQHFKQVLLEQKSAILDKDRLSKLDLSTKPEDRLDEADLASSDIDQNMRMRMGNRENLYLKKVIQALERIEDNTYGECTSCGAHIGVGRLTVRPTAELCIICKEEEEKYEKNSFHGKRHKSLGRTLGAKLSVR